MTPSRPTLYLAAPLFTPLERAFNQELAERLGEHFSVFLPQRDGVLVAAVIEDGGTAVDAVQRAFSTDLRAIRASEVFLAVLDGAAVDEGVAFELGYAAACELTCVGLKTDLRQRLPWGENPMISESIETIHQEVESLMEWAERYVADRLGEG